MQYLYWSAFKKLQNWLLLLEKSSYWYIIVLIIIIIIIIESVVILINFIFKDDPLSYCVSLDTFLAQDILDMKLSVNRESNQLLKIQLLFHTQSQYFGENNITVFQHFLLCYGWFLMVWVLRFKTWVLMQKLLRTVTSHLNLCDSGSDSASGAPQASPGQQHLPSFGWRENSISHRFLLWHKGLSNCLVKFWFC